MILFKPEHVPLILSGRKTQTRRLGKKRWRVGAVHQCKTQLFGGEPFARVRIKDVRQEVLCEMSEADVHAEGYDSFPEYFAALCRINHVSGMSPTALVWRVEFELVAP